VGADQHRDGENHRADPASTYSTTYRKPRPRWSRTVLGWLCRAPEAASRNSSKPAEPSRDRPSLASSGSGVRGRARTGGPRFRNRSEEDREALQDKDLEPTQGAAYRPAYSEIPPELARLVTVWHKLPEPIRKAIWTLVEASVQDR
jgi:hypothetical protein